MHSDYVRRESLGTTAAGIGRVLVQLIARAQKHTRRREGNNSLLVLRSNCSERLTPALLDSQRAEPHSSQDKVKAAFTSAIRVCVQQVFTGHLPVPPLLSPHLIAGACATRGLVVREIRARASWTAPVSDGPEALVLPGQQ